MIKQSKHNSTKCTAKVYKRVLTTVLTPSYKVSIKAVCEKRNKCEQKIQSFVSFSRALKWEACLKNKRVSDCVAKHKFLSWHQSDMKNKEMAEFTENVVQPFSIFRALKQEARLKRERECEHDAIYGS